MILIILLFIKKNFISPLARFEEEKRAHEAKMTKMEAEMKMVFQQKVQEKKNKLMQSDADVIFYLFFYLFYYNNFLYIFILTIII